MGHSSRIVGCLACVVAFAPATQAAAGNGHMAGGVGMAAVPRGVAIGAPTHGTPRQPIFVAPRAVPQFSGAGGTHVERAGFRRADVRRVPNWRRRWRVGPFTGIDYGYGYGDGTAQGGASDPGFVGEGPYGGGPDEPPYPLLPPQPCVRPLLIKIGQGANRKTTATYVVYGGPPACIAGYGY